MKMRSLVIGVLLASTLLLSACGGEEEVVVETEVVTETETETEEVPKYITNEDAPKGKVINTTGAGDSTVAGFLAGYSETKDYSYALKLGLCCGSATAFSDSLASKDNIESLFNQATIDVRNVK